MKFLEIVKDLLDKKIDVIDVKLPTWEGFWRVTRDSIMMHCKEGYVKNILETDRLFYTIQNICSDEFVIADETNCPLKNPEVEITYSFDYAKERMLKGFAMYRKSWEDVEDYDAMIFDKDKSEFALIKYMNNDAELNKTYHSACLIGADVIANDWKFYNVKDRYDYTCSGLEVEGLNPTYENGKVTIKEVAENSGIELPSFKGTNGDYL